jgi:ABC-type dipeptide/oligopeptide/nickel transport system permease component
MLPVITVSGIQFGTLMGGTVIIEKIFNIPGMGSLLINAIQTRDYPQVQAIVIIITVLILALNLIVDVLYAWLNPRIRYA